MKALGVAIFLLSPNGAVAAEFHKKVPLSFCTPAAQIERKVEECELNDLYLESGERCLDLLDAEAKAVAGILPESFSGNGKEKQTEKFISSLTDYRASSRSLAHLISTTELAMREIELYKSKLAYPPDYDEPDVNQGDVTKYIESVECYGKNRENLLSLLADFQRRHRNLQEAKTLADRMGATSDQRRAGLDGSASSEQKIVEGKGQGTGFAGKPNQRRPSTITGVERDKAKSKRKP